MHLPYGSICGIGNYVDVQLARFKKILSKITYRGRSPFVVVSIHYGLIRVAKPRRLGVMVSDRDHKKGCVGAEKWPLSILRS